MIDEARRAKQALSVGLARQRGRRLPGARAPQDRAGCRDGPDLRARPAQRLPAARLDDGAGGRGEAQRSGARRARGARLDEGSRAGDAGPQGPGGGRIRLRQQHPPGREGGGPRERLRLPGLRAGLHPPAVLRRHRPVPLGRALGRSRGHLPDRREGEGTDPGRRAPAPLARHGARAHQVPGPAGAHLLGRAQGSRAARARLQRDGGEGRALGAGRDRPRSPRLRLGREPEPRDRGDEGRLRCGFRLGVSERAAQHRERRDLGVDPPRRRRRHGLLAARRRRDRLRRHGCRGRSASRACCATTPAPA